MAGRGKLLDACDEGSTAPFISLKLPTNPRPLACVTTIEWPILMRLSANFSSAVTSPCHDSLPMGTSKALLVVTVY